MTDRRTVRGLLDLLELNADGIVADHAHAPDRRSIAAYLEGTWPHERYDVLYIASHGDSGAIIDEYGEAITLAWLGNRLEDACRGRAVILAGCKTADISARSAERFLELTKADVLAGYRRSVDWLKSAAMDLIVLEALASEGPGPTGEWDRLPHEVLEGVATTHAGFVESLGWHSWKSPRRRRPRAARSPDAYGNAADELLDLAIDDAVDERQRVRALQAVASLGISDRRLGQIVRSPGEPLRVRKAALAAIKASDDTTRRGVLERLEKRIASDASDPGRDALMPLLRAR